ncbi:MAG: tRNA pseudouridine(38-40) synthase TruA [Planctomycetes bacterium]|nr:tRNA pseudouridine(38-40) synthase TruA [Planctomycetota bacterium]
MATYLLTISYDGSRYHGWQRQAGFPTVQEEMEKALAAIDCPGVRVEGAGRTDTGVHAIGQCAHVVLPRPFPPERLQLALNANLPEDVAVQRVRSAPDGFHARFHARGKRYVYRCLVSRVRPAIGRQYYHWVRRAVDVAAMRAAAACLRGTHDFASFAANPGYTRKRGTVRRLDHVHLVGRPGGFDFAVQGSGFLYNMVRNLVGSLLEVGYGNRPPEWFAEILAARRRSLAGPTAPAAGLYLQRVLYGRDLAPAGREPGGSEPLVDADEDGLDGE